MCLTRKILRAAGDPWDLCRSYPGFGCCDGAATNGPLSDIVPSGKATAYALIKEERFHRSKGIFLPSERVERRLAAVLAADVAGYSRSMGRDEERTHEQLRTFRKTRVDPEIAAHRGRIVKKTGDGMLVEFASVVDAARCALKIKRTIAKTNH